jgi:cytochrome d ubiquinol oxidase subunit II
MIFDYETIKLVWWLLIGILLIGFAITDGMDMGVGVLLPFVGETDSERRVIINTVGPHWDGNQVWLITAGGAIFAAWPAVYAAAFSGFYFAMMLALFALFFRPVGFDYRSKIDDPRWRNTWDWGLFIGGTVPALVFGIAFGNLIQGVPFHLDELLRVHYTGSFFGLFNPFALLTGVVSLSMLTMHGAVWLQLRTEGQIAERAQIWVKRAAKATLASFVLAGLWVAFGLDGFQIISQPALDAMPNPLAKTVEPGSGALLSMYGKQPLTILFPFLGLAGAALTLLFSVANRPGFGYITSALTLIGIIMTAGVSMFPFIMPSTSNPSSSFTVWDAVSSHLTLTIMFWAVAFLLPIVIGYTLWCYSRMWGKITIADIESNRHSAY